MFWTKNRPPQYKTTKIVKQPYLCGVLLIFSTFSQVRVGLTLGRASSLFVMDNSKYIHSPQVGLVFEVPYTNRRMFQIELNYLQKGTRINAVLVEQVNK